MTVLPLAVDNICFLFFFFCMLSNFALHLEYFECYILETSVLLQHFFCLFVSVFKYVLSINSSCMFVCLFFFFFNFIFYLPSCSIAKSCVTVCDSMDCSMPGFLYFTIFQGLLKLMSIESVMPSNHLFSFTPFSFCSQSFPALESFPMS